MRYDVDYYVDLKPGYDGVIAVEVVPKSGTDLSTIQAQVLDERQYLTNWLIGITVEEDGTYSTFNTEVADDNSAADDVPDTYAGLTLQQAVDIYTQMVEKAKDGALEEGV